MKRVNMYYCHRFICGDSSIESLKEISTWVRRFNKQKKEIIKFFFLTSKRLYESVFDCKIHLDRQECIVHTCRSKFCNHILIAEDCLILGDMQRHCLPKWYRHTNTNLFLLSIVIQFNIFINLNQLFLFFFNSIYLSPRISIPLTDIKSLIELFQYSKFHINLCYFFSHRLFY